MPRNYYVLARYNFDGKRQYFNRQLFPQWLDKLDRATPFPAVSALLDQVMTTGRNDGDHIVRVEETTTPSTSRRIEVPLGDPRQTGVALKSSLLAGYWSVAPNQETLLVVLQDACVSAGKRLVGNPVVVGIAEETTPGTTSYTETVLA